MGQIQQIDYPIVGSYNNQRITNIDAERSINMFEYIDSKGKKDKSLINTSGLLNSGVTFTGASGGFRTQFQFNNFMYVVIGSNVYRIDITGNAVKLNTLPLNTNTGFVGIDANNAINPQIIIVDGVNGYIIDTVLNTFTQITDTSFPIRPIDVCFLDGFFVVANGGTNTFQLSSLNQGLVWGGSNDALTANSVTQILTIGAPGNNTNNYQTGVAVTIIATGVGVVPGGLNPSAVITTYYVIRIDNTTIKLASTLSNALMGIALSPGFTDNGTFPFFIVGSGQLQLGAITSHPGTIVSCRTLHRRLFLFSQNYTEVWENSGQGANLPFRRTNSLLMEVGTPSIGSVVVGFDMMFFLSQDRDGLGSVMQVLGAQPIPISNRALDFQLAQYASDPNLVVANTATGVTDARGVMVKENGIIFYRLNFTAANATYVYNATLSNPLTEEGKLWHEEMTLYLNRHPAQTHAYYNGNNYYGSYNNPIMYLVNTQFTTNDGEAIPRIRIGQSVTPPGYQRTRIDRFHLDLRQGDEDLSQVVIEVTDLAAETGFILDTESGIDIIIEDTISDDSLNNNPIIYLSISKDGGESYGYKIPGFMGKIGERTYRTVWRKLGTIPRGQGFVPKIEFYGELPFVILGAAWVHEVMPE